MLSAIGGVAPWLVLKPIYEARGLVRVAPSGRVIMYRTEDNQSLPHYDSFVNTQQQLLTGRRILSAAMEDERLQNTSWPSGQAGAVALASSITASRPRGSEIVVVSLRSPDPVAAAVALNAVLEAYRKIQIEGELRESEEQESLLETRLADLTRRATSARDSALNAARPVTPDALTRMLDFRTNDLAGLKSAITQAQMRGADPATPPNEDEVGVAPVAEITDTQLEMLLARRDSAFASLSQVRARTDLELIILSGQVGDQHPSLLQKARQLESLTQRVEERLAEFRNELADAEARAAANRPPDEAASPPLTLLERLQAQQAGIEREIESLAAKLQDIQKWLNESARFQAEADQTRQRLEQLQFERRDQSFGRITIEEWAAPPTKPATDRRLPLSAAGGLAGLGGGAALVVLFGLLRPAVRYSDDADDLKTTAPLLAAIPDVSSRDQEDRQTAAFCVHHLRHLIEASMGDRGRTSLTITSPGPGDGKTQITLGLASSFANAGRRVLAIDLDFVGRGLSRATETDEQPGLAEYLAGEGPLERAICQTEVQPFAVLPAGQPDPEFAASLDSTKLHTILSTLGERFDLILVDTGPILGSLEASSVVGCTDSVLVVVGRGQRAMLVQAAVTRVQSLGGVCLGLVFNRAGSMDVSRSVGSISLRSTSANGRGPGSPPQNGAKPSLYQAVTRSTESDPTAT